MTAALQVASETGFGQATLDAIARRAGVTRGALYHHFSSKDEVFDTALRERADEVMRPLVAQLAGDQPALQRIGNFLRAYCAALDHDAEFRQVVGLLLADTPTPDAKERTAAGFTAFLEAFEAVLREAQDAGDLRDGLSPRTAAVSVVSTAVGATWASLQAPGMFAPAALAGPLADTLVAGLRA